MIDLNEAIAVAREIYGRERDDTGQPYIKHVLRVVDNVDDCERKVVAALQGVLEIGVGWNPVRLHAVGAPVPLVADIVVLTDYGQDCHEYIEQIEVFPVARSVNIACFNDISHSPNIRDVSEAKRKNSRPHSRNSRRLIK